MTVQYHDTEIDGAYTPVEYAHDLRRWPGLPAANDEPRRGGPIVVLAVACAGWVLLGLFGWLA